MNVINSILTTTVHVKDITKARSFYTNAFGFKELQYDAAGKKAVFRVPGTEIPFSIHQWDGMCARGPMEGRPPGTVSGIVFSVNDVSRAANDLKAKGARVTFGPEKLPDGTVLAAIADPDGNEFVLVPTGSAPGA